MATVMLGRLTTLSTDLVADGFRGPDVEANERHAQLPDVAIQGPAVHGPGYSNDQPSHSGGLRRGKVALDRPAPENRDAVDSLTVYEGRELACWNGRDGR